MMDWHWMHPDDRLQMVKERQAAIRRSVELDALAMRLRPRPAPRRPVRLAVGTGLAWLGLRLGGPAAVRAALGEAR